MIMENGLELYLLANVNVYLTKFKGLVQKKNLHNKLLV